MSKLSPEEKTRIIAMREVGYSHISIAKETGRSIASVKRVCKTHRVRPGELEEQTLEDTRDELRRKIAGDAKIQELAAATVHDTTVISEALREKLFHTLAHLPSTPTEALATMKGLNMAANTLKLTADAIRSAQKLDTSNYVDESELPQLVVETISEEEVAELRAQQEAEERELYGYEGYEEQTLEAVH